MKVAVSYLKSNDKVKCIAKIDQSDADYIHVDLCDGKYVETKNFIISEVIKLLKGTIKPLDVHLMTLDPLKYIEKLALLNIETITVHPSACKDVKKTIEEICEMGFKAGLAINPDEDIDIIMPYLDIIDEVLIMSVVPGKGGQAFMPEVLDKIDKLNEIKDNYHFITSVDGGINAETISYLNNKNIELIVSGSYITDSEDYNSSINLLKESV